MCWYYSFQDSPYMCGFGWNFMRGENGFFMMQLVLEKNQNVYWYGFWQFFIRAGDVKMILSNINFIYKKIMLFYFVFDER